MATNPKSMELIFEDDQTIVTDYDTGLVVYAAYSLLDEANRADFVALILEDFDQGVTVAEQFLSIYEEDLQELSRDKLQQYVDKASDDVHISRTIAHELQSKPHVYRPNHAAVAKFVKKTDQRQGHIEKAVKKMVTKAIRMEGVVNEALSDFKKKPVRGLYHYSHYEHPDGRWIQIKHGGTPENAEIVYKDSIGNQQKFDSFKALKKHLGEQLIHEQDTSDCYVHLNKGPKGKKVFGPEPKARAEARVYSLLDLHGPETTLRQSGKNYHIDASHHYKPRVQNEDANLKELSNMKVQQYVNAAREYSNNINAIQSHLAMHGDVSQFIDPKSTFNKNKQRLKRRERGLKLAQNEERELSEGQIVGKFSVKERGFDHEFERHDNGNWHAIVMTKSFGKPVRAVPHVGNPKYIQKKWDDLKKKYNNPNIQSQQHAMKRFSKQKEE